MSRGGTGFNVAREGIRARPDAAAAKRAAGPHDDFVAFGPRAPYRRTVDRPARSWLGGTVTAAVSGVFLLAASAVALAQRNPDPFGSQPRLEPAATGVALYIENDLFGFGTDQNYTGGFAVSLGGRWVFESGLAGPLSLFDAISRIRKAHEAREVHVHSFAIVGSAFTPLRERLSDVTPVFDDRPYASIFGVLTRRVSVRRKDDRMQREDRAVSSELSIAGLGLNVAKALQTDLHRMNRRRSGKTTPVDPLGWHNQISNGGEPTLLYKVGLEQLIAGEAPKGGFQGQLTWLNQASIGYYTNVATGLAGRLGWMKSNFWEFSTNPLNSLQQKSVRDSADAKPYEAYGFFGLRGRGVVYNALLQGQFRESIHTFDAGSINRGIAEGETGLAFTAAPGWLGGAVTLTWIALSTRTPEFKGPSARAHVWGAVHLMYSPRASFFNP